MGVGCSLDDLPCCTKNTSTTGEVVRARPLEYASADDQVGKGEVPTWPPQDLQDGDDKDNSPQKGRMSSASQVSTPGFAEGVEGQETYEDGSSYTGQLANGRRHGNGTWKSTVEQYTGQWVNDQRDGYGRQTWQDGRAYEGSFKQGKFHGKGRMEWHTPNGLMLYDGEYQEDLKHGEGKYVWPDGRMYNGGWKEGQRSGQATYTNAQGQSRRGIWKNDKVEKWLDDPPK